MEKKLNEVTKTIGGTEYPASSFLVVEDPETVGTWHLPVKDPDGTPNHRLMGAAWAALHGGYRGQKYAGPGKTEAIRKLRSLYSDEDMETPSTEVKTPDGLDDLDALMVEEERAAEVGKRLQSKQLEALRQAAQAIGSLLKWAEYGDGEEEPDEEAEVLTPIMQLASDIMRVFYAEFSQEGEYWPVDIVLGHPALGNALIAKEQSDGTTYAVPFVGGDGVEVEFAPKEMWMNVTATYVPVTVPPEPEEPEPEPMPLEGSTETEAEAVQVGESFAGIVGEMHVVEEAEGHPLEMSVVLIQPGFGNKRDNHYYPAEMLKRDAHIFEGAKMYETDHVQKEKSTRTWVSTVKRIQGFTEEGAPVGEVIVHDPGFAERVRNLEKAGMIEKMECSILAVGRAKKGEVNGQKANVVEELTEALSVDWVTQAGAGGKAIAISETEEPPTDLPEVIDEPAGVLSADNKEHAEPELEAGETIPEPEVHEEKTEPQETIPVYLAEGEVTRIVEKRAGLPDATKKRITSQTFETELQVNEAIDREVAYLKQVTNAGKPFGQGTTLAETAGTKARMTDEEYEARMAKILEKYT